MSCIYCFDNELRKIRTFELNCEHHPFSVHFTNQHTNNRFIDGVEWLNRNVAGGDYLHVTYTYLYEGRKGDLSQALLWIQRSIKQIVALRLSSSVLFAFVSSFPCWPSHLLDAGIHQFRYIYWIFDTRLDTAWKRLIWSD